MARRKNYYAFTDFNYTDGASPCNSTSNSSVYILY